MPRTRRHAPDPNVAEIAAVMGDGARAAMLFALLDGGELPASELAARAAVSPQAATAHLKKLTAATLLAARTSGRQRLFRLASEGVARAMEALAAIAPPVRIVALPQNETMQRLREARSCYDHLAGRLGVAVTTALVRRGALRPAGEEFAVPGAGRRLFASLGIDLAVASASRRSFARACIDWTERRPHVAGSLGASLLDLFLENRWVARNAHDRALRVTPAGRNALHRYFRLTLGA